MISQSFDGLDHEAHMHRAFELAREAADRGDRPFGSVLVRGDTVIMAESNRVVTADDIRRHPELHLAYRACRELDRDEIAEFTGADSTVRSAEILDGISEVVGPVLNGEGRQIHRDFEW